MIIVQVLAFILVMTLVFSKRIPRCMVFLAAVMFMQDRIVLFDGPPLITFHRAMVYGWLISTCWDYKSLIKESRGFPAWAAFSLLLSCFFLTALFDQRHTTAINLYRAVDAFIQSYCVLFLAYSSFKKGESFYCLLPFFNYASILLCLYGIFNFVTHTNPYDEWVTATFGGESFFIQYLTDEGDRFRVNSFVSHPIYYGYLLVLIFYFILFFVLIYRRFISTSIVSLVLIFVNIFLANSRTPILCLFAGLPIFALCFFKGRRLLDVSILSFVAVLILAFIPSIVERVGNTFDIFISGGQKVQGSSVDMRISQFAASYKHFQRAPIFGNGLYYISENLGLSSNPDSRVDDADLLGLESHLFFVMIEQGVAGLIANTVFFLSITVFLIRRMKVQARIAVFGATILMIFLLYITATGSSGTWVVTMTLLGIVIKWLQLFYLQAKTISAQHVA